MSFTYRTLLTIGVKTFCDGVWPLLLALLISFWFRILGFNGGGVDSCWAGVYPIQSFELWARFLTDMRPSVARPVTERVGDICCCWLNGISSSDFGTITRCAWTVCSCGIWQMFLTGLTVMIGVGTIFGRIGIAGGDIGMLLAFTFVCVCSLVLWPAKLLRRLAGFSLVSCSGFNSSGGGGGKGSSWLSGETFSTFGGGGKSGEGIRSEGFFGGRSGTQSSIDIIWPIIIAPSRSFDRCWFCWSILSRIEVYSDADEVLKRYKRNNMKSEVMRLWRNRRDRNHILFNGALISTNLRYRNQSIPSSIPC